MISFERIYPNNSKSVKFVSNQNKYDLTNIILFDDHEIILDSLRLYFDEIDGICICASFTEPKKLLNYLESADQIDYIITDVLTDDEIGLSLFENLHQNFPHIKLIAYTSITSEFVKDELQKYNVISVVNKKEKPDVILEIIRNYDTRIGNNKTYQSAYFLTPKEKEIAHYLVKGLAAKEIASLTNTAVNTINNQKNKLLEKFECTNSTELIVKLSQLGLLKVL